MSRHADIAHRQPEESLVEAGLRLHAVIEQGGWSEPYSTTVHGTANREENVGRLGPLRLGWVNGRCAFRQQGVRGGWHLVAAPAGAASLIAVVWNVVGALQDDETSRRRAWAPVVAMLAPPTPLGLLFVERVLDSVDIPGLLGLLIEDLEDSLAAD